MAYHDGVARVRSGVAGLPVSILPILLAPMAFGCLILIAFPGSAAGPAAVVCTTIAVAWYALGGAVAAGHLRRSIAERRALAAIRHRLEVSEDPTLVCADDGRVIYANPAAAAHWGVVPGTTALALLAQFRADAAADLARLSGQALHRGTGELEMPDGMVLALTHQRGAAIRLLALRKAGAAADPALLVPLADPGPSMPADGEFESIPVALLRVARDGRIHDANAAARLLLGGALVAELDQPQHLGSLLEGPGRPVGEWVEDVCEGRMHARSEILTLKAGPDPRLSDSAGAHHFQVTLAADPLRQRMAVAVLSDASALKTLEAQFAQSQKMHAIGQLAGGVAHDFNNLLTAISGHCDLLMLRHDKSDPDYADLDQISQNSNRAAALVGQLLAFSRKQTLKLQTLDLRDTLADLNHLLNRLVGERVGLTIDNDPGLRPIRADRRQLEQVLMNLVVNARDAMPGGGDISVRSENVHLEQPLVRDRVSLPQGEYVRISVTDEGTGIEPAVLDKIFEPFFTTKRTGEGTGLGLSTAYGIVKQTGGYIFCDSTVGQGTCFSLYFPAQPHAVPLPVVPVSPPRAVPETSTSTQRATVLLVEDEAPVRAFAARALRLKGYEVLEADSAEDALDTLSDSLLQIDVFVTDVVMPGMDGPSWVRTALIDRPETRVVFMSGYTDDIFGEGHAPVPNSVFLAKPFTLNELTQMVARQLTSTSGQMPH